jgi:integrase
LILLALVREFELLLARCEDVHFESGEWHIPEQNSKIGKPHIVYLGTQAIALFEELRALASDSAVVMPGRSSLTRPFSANALNKALEGLFFPFPPFTIHNLRRPAARAFTKWATRPM